MDFDRFVHLVLGRGTQAFKGLGLLIFLALFFPVWTMMSGFGHTFLGYSFPGNGLHVWEVLVYGVLALTLLWSLLKKTAIPFVIGIPLTLIALTGATPEFRVVGPLTGIATTELVMLGIGLLIYFGTVFVYAVTPGQAATIVRGLQPARENFQSFMIFMFWFVIVSWLVGRFAPRLPFEVTITMITFVFIVIPGFLATTGQTGFDIAFRVTIVAFGIHILVAITMGLQAVGLVGSWEQILVAIKTLAEKSTDFTKPMVWYAWGLAFFSAWALVKPAWGAVTEFRLPGVVRGIKGLTLGWFLTAIYIWLTVGNGATKILNKTLHVSIPSNTFPIEIPIRTSDQLMFYMYLPLSMAFLILCIIQYFRNKDVHLIGAFLIAVAGWLLLLGIRHYSIYLG